MSERDRSSEYRARLLSRAKIPPAVAVNEDAPILVHRLRLLAFYGLQEKRFFRNHLHSLEQSGRSKALSLVDIADRVAVTDPSMSQVTLVRIEPPGHTEAKSSHRFDKNEEEQHAT